MSISFSVEVRVVGPHAKSGGVIKANFDVRAESMTEAKTVAKREFNRRYRKDELPDRCLLVNVESAKGFDK